MLKLHNLTIQGHKVAYEYGDSLPEGEGNQTGDIAAAAQFRTVTSALNLASMSNGCQPISQGWPAGDCTKAGGTFEALQWRIPLASSAHNVLRFVIDAEGVGAGSGVKIKAEGTGQEKTATFDGRETKIVDITIGQGAAGVGINSDFDQITLTMIGNAGSVTLYSVDSSYIPPAAVINSDTYLADGSSLPFYRVGSNVLQDNSSISSLVGHLTRSNIEAISARHRSLGSWSSFGSGDIDNSLGWYGTSRSRRLVMIQPGTAGGRLTIHLRTVNTTGDVQTLEIGLTEPGGERVGALSVDVPAAQPATWTVHEMSLSEGGRIPSTRRPLTPEPFLWLGVNTLEMTSRSLIGVSAWAE